MPYSMYRAHSAQYTARGGIIGLLLVVNQGLFDHTSWLRAKVYLKKRKGEKNIGE